MKSTVQYSVKWLITGNRATFLQILAFSEHKKVVKKSSRNSAITSQTLFDLSFQCNKLYCCQLFDAETGT